MQRQIFVSCINAVKRQRNLGLETNVHLSVVIKDRERDVQV